MLWVVKDFVTAGILGDHAPIHHQDIIADFGHHAQVVGDDHERQIQVPLQPLEQFQDLSLNHYIQGGGGLVGNEDSGQAGQGHGDNRALSHPTTVLVGIVPASSGRYAHHFQELTGPFACSLGLPFEAVELQHLHDLALDGAHRIEGIHCPLENHGHAIPSDLAHLGFAVLE